MKIKTLIETIPCSRCGKLLASHAGGSLEHIRQQTPAVCSDCATEEERHNTNMAVGDAVLQMLEAGG